MRRRFVLLVSLLTLLSVGVLSVRPITADFLGIAPSPQELRLSEPGDGGQHCRMVADCDVTTVTTAPFDVSGGQPLLFFAGLMLLVAAAILRPSLSFAPTLSTPPPKLASS